MSGNINNPPPAPIIIPPIERGTGRFVQVWAQWFTNIFTSVEDLISQVGVTVSGTANEVTVVTTNSNAVVSLPTTIIIPRSFNSTTNIYTGASIALTSNDGYVDTINAPSSAGSKFNYTLPSVSGTLSVGGNTLLSSQTVSGVTTVTFGTAQGWTSTYNTYVIKFYNVTTATTAGYLIYRTPDDRNITATLMNYPSSGSGWNFETTSGNGPHITFSTYTISTGQTATCSGTLEFTNCNSSSTQMTCTGYSTYYNTSELLQFCQFAGACGTVPGGMTIVYTGGGTMSGTFDLYGMPG